MFCAIFAPTILQAIATTTSGCNTLRAKASTKKNFPRIPTLLPGRRRVFQMFFPQVQTGFCSVQDIFFSSWIIIFLTPVPSRIHCPKVFRFLTLARLLSSCRLAHLSAVTNTALPTFSLQFLRRLLGRRRASPQQPAALTTAQTRRALCC